MGQNFDDAFNKKYEEALEGLSDEQVSQVAKLNRSQIIEWVNSPARIRPFLLLQWSTDGRKQDDSIPSSNKAGDQSSPRQFVKEKEKESNRMLKIAVSVSDFLEDAVLLLQIVPTILFFFSIISIGIYSGNYFSWLIVSERNPSKALEFRLFIIVGTCILFFSVGKGMKERIFRHGFTPFTALFSVVGLLAGLFIGISGGDYGVLVLPGFYIELGPHILGSSVGCITGMFFGFLIDMVLDYWQERVKINARLQSS